MKKYRYLSAAAAIILSILPLSAKEEANDNYSDPYEGYDEFVYMDMVLYDNIEQPKVGKKEHKQVRSYMAKLKDKLKGHYTLDLTRDDEVLIVTLPTDDLFLPNDTLLTPYGVKMITPLLQYMQDPMMYKIVYTVHTDDSGDPSYLSRLSEARMSSFYGWITDNDRVPEDLIIIPYPMGDREHIVDNNTRINRARNRRIELYFIPGPKMIELAHQNKLRF